MLSDTNGGDGEEKTRIGKISFPDLIASSFRFFSAAPGIFCMAHNLLRIIFKMCEMSLPLKEKNKLCEILKIVLIH